MAQSFDPERKTEVRTIKCELLGSTFLWCGLVMLCFTRWLILYGALHFSTNLANLVKTFLQLLSVLLGILLSNKPTSLFFIIKISRVSDDEDSSPTSTAPLSDVFSTCEIHFMDVTSMLTFEEG